MPSTAPARHAAFAADSRDRDIAHDEHAHMDDSEPDKMQAFAQLIRTSETFSAQLQRELQAVGLTISQLGVLETLHHDGPMCQRDIGEKLNKSRGNVTTVVDNLERRKLVKRVRNKDDRRYITLYLTDKGRETVEAIYPVHAERVATVMDSLSDSDLEALRQILSKLDAALHDDD